VVTLRDHDTKQRKMYSLGRYGTPESREAYHRLIAAWESAGRKLPHLDRQRATHGDVSVSKLCLVYWRWLKGAYLPQSIHTHRDAIRILREHHGSSPAESIGPNCIRELREVMVRQRGWSRTYANRQCKRIAQMFKWGAARELVPAAVYDQIRLLEPLRKGELDARENTPRSCVDPSLVRATLPHLGDTVRAMVELQMVTGMRPCALTIVRGQDIDREGDVWVYTPGSEIGGPKYAPVVLGPRAQAIIALRMFQPWAFCTRKGDHYTTASYRRAITRACERADLERWTPYQLRHTVITAIEKSHGLMAASLVAGHSSAKITDAVYTHRDLEAVTRVVMDVG
jgi:integrase